MKLSHYAPLPPSSGHGTECGRDTRATSDLKTVVTTTLRTWTRSQSTSDEDRDVITYRMFQAATVE